MGLFARRMFGSCSKGSHQTRKGTSRDGNGCVSSRDIIVERYVGVSIPSVFYDFTFRLFLEGGGRGRSSVVCHHWAVARSATALPLSNMMLPPSHMDATYSEASCVVSGMLN